MSSELINEFREAGIDEFRSLGIPHKKIENYKYTDLTKYFQQDYHYQSSAEKISFRVQDVFRCGVPDIDTNVIILLNGFYYEQFNNTVKLPEGLIVDSFQKASHKYPDLFKKHYGRYARIQGNHLTAMNTAFVQDGVFIYLKKNSVVDKPLQVINLLMSDNDIMVQQRNLFIMEENAQMDLVICDHTLSGNEYLSNQVTELYSGRNSHLNLSRMQHEHNKAIELTNLWIHQEEDSTVDTNTITLHGGLVRNNVEVKLNGENCLNNTNGLFLTDNTQHVDNFVNIEHAAPHCQSNQLFKGILDDYSTGAFSGKILVKKDAQKTGAYQRNNNIILSDYAKMNAKPQLEIYADDVKCSHGATVGQINEDAMFYMQSRGIPEKEARLLLMFAFAHEVIEQIPVQPLKERMDHLVRRRLNGELPKCNECAFSGSN
jgi:Fe-S cluster assembly protein SufD